MDNPKIELTKDGSNTLVHTKYNAHYHSTAGAIIESDFVYIKSGLDFFIESTQEKSVSVLEIGFGSGLNAINTYRYAIEHEVFVEYIGIDKTYNYKNYGDFAGANVDIVSKNYTGSGMLEVGSGFSVNSNAISQDKFYLQDGPNFTGFSKVNEPANGLANYNFSTSWDKQAATPINSSYYVRGGDSYAIGENSKFSFFVNGSFDNAYSIVKFW